MSRTASSATSADPTGVGARRRAGLGLGPVLVIVLFLGGAIALIDQLTKNWAEANLPLLDPQPFLGEFLQFTLLYNSGAAWGMGSGITPVVTVLQIGIAIGVVVFAVRAVRSSWYALALAMILGGALGNIHDRLLRPPGPFRGEVVDFLELPNWPVFNIADMGVVGGAILVVLLGVIGVSPDPAREAEEDAAAAAAGGDAEPQGTEEGR
ncbi:signal peptidase II [Brachybacterium squillarum]|uniref:signal peptidase II n=1 Tax=Brachybacterium squillarum TaxID=661979 RepID=UPI0002629B46|nr:signal peptidase II [Brachybacterium squillarum]